jgi:hypothetical protein
MFIRLNVTKFHLSSGWILDQWNSIMYIKITSQKAKNIPKIMLTHSVVKKSLPNNRKVAYAPYIHKLAAIKKSVRFSDGTLSKSDVFIMKFFM